MKLIHYPLPAETSAGASCAMPVTRLKKCRAYRGRDRCAREFVQFALSEHGAFADLETPDAVRYTPDNCPHCERPLLAAEGRRAAYAEQRALHPTHT